MNFLIFIKIYILIKKKMKEAGVPHREVLYNLEAILKKIFLKIYTEHLF